MGLTGGCCQGFLKLGCAGVLVGCGAGSSLECTEASPVMSFEDVRGLV